MGHSHPHKTMKTLTSKQIAEVVKIGRPVKKAKVSQVFGKSKFPKLQKWYKSFGWLGQMVLILLVQVVKVVMLFFLVRLQKT